MEITREPTTSLQEVGVIYGKEEPFFLLQTSKQAFKVKKSFSCIMEPEIGDKVLLTSLEKEQYILAILDRPKPQSVRISFPEETKIETKEGSLTFISEGKVSLIASDAVEMTSPSLTCVHQEGQLYCNQFEASFDTLRAQSKTLTWFSETVESTVNRMMVRMKNCFRWVEGLDQKKTGTLLHIVRKTLCIRARHSFYSNEKDVKFNGERIHMG